MHIVMASAEAAWMPHDLACDGKCRMLLPEATRAWREGVPTVIVMETGYDLSNTSTAFQQGTKTHLEQFADYPDLTDRSFKMGDMRYEFKATSL